MIAQGYQAMLAEEVFVAFMYGTKEECGTIERLLEEDGGQSRLDEIDALVKGIKGRLAKHPKN